MKGNVWSLNSLAFLPKKNWSICEIKQSSYAGTAFYHSYFTYAGGKIQQQSSRALLAPPAHHWQPDEQGKYSGSGTIEAFLMKTEIQKSQMAHLLKLQCWFFCSLNVSSESVWWHFLYKLPDQTLSALFFIVIAFFWGSVSWVNSKLKGFVPNWNGMKFQIPSPNGRPSFS